LQAVQLEKAEHDTGQQHGSAADQHVHQDEFPLDRVVTHPEHLGPSHAMDSFSPQLLISAVVNLPEGRRAPWPPGLPRTELGSLPGPVESCRRGPRIGACRSPSERYTYWSAPGYLSSGSPLTS